MYMIKQELTSHLKECFDEGCISKFPVSKKRKLKNQIAMEEVCSI